MTRHGKIHDVIPRPCSRRARRHMCTMWTRVSSFYFLQLNSQHDIHIYSAYSTVNHSMASAFIHPSRHPARGELRELPSARQAVCARHSTRQSTRHRRPMRRPILASIIPSTTRTRCHTAHPIGHHPALAAACPIALCRGVCQLRR